MQRGPLGIESPEIIGKTTVSGDPDRREVTILLQQDVPAAIANLAHNIIFHYKFMVPRGDEQDSMALFFVGNFEAAMSDLSIGVNEFVSREFGSSKSAIQW